MTIADKKQCLLQLRALEEQIKKADEKRVEAIAALNSTAINYSGTPSGNGKHNKIEIIYLKMKGFFFFNFTPNIEIEIINIIINIGR